MGYLVTARKWRPKTFNEVVGQEHITSTLKNAIKENRIAHAYMFTGPRGVGKTTTARIFSKSINCLNQKDAEPCNECENCKAIQSSQLMDIIEIDAASNRGIDEIRTLRESVKYEPTKGKYKIYIIDEVHMLTKESFNAFLKTLEEPPPHTIFIFATTDVHKVPLTIISRCQRYDFRRIQLDTIKETLSKIAKAEKIKIDDTTLTIIAKKADGALRDAESYFDQVVAYCKGKINADTVSQMLNLIDEELYFKISDAVLEKNYTAVFDVTESIYKNGWNFIDFTNGLIEHFRNILTVVLSEKTDYAETADVFKSKYFSYFDRFAVNDLLRILNYLNRLNQELKFSQNQKLKIEVALSHLIGLEKTAAISDLISDVNSKKNSNESSSQTEHKKGLFEPPKSTPDLTKLKNNNSEKPSKKKVEAEVSMVNTDLNFDYIVDKWKTFVDAITNEKSLFLSHAITDVKLNALRGNNLFISIPNTESVKTFSMHEKYIENKSEFHFGKRLRFTIENDSSIVSKNDVKVKKTQKPSSKERKSDIYEDIIINELNGQKID